MTLTADDLYSITFTTSITVTGMSGGGDFDSAVQGTAFTVQVATFSDNDSDSSSYTASNYTATLTWGDGNVSTGTIVANAARTGCSVTGTNPYSTAGVFDPSIAITRIPDSYAITLTGEMDVTTVTPTAQTLSGQRGGTFLDLVATFTDAVTGLPAVDYSAFIDWADGRAIAFRPRALPVRTYGSSRSFVA